MSYWKTLTTQFATEGWKWWNSQENINFYPLIHRKLFESTIKLSEVFLETSYGEYIIIRFYNTLNLNQQDKIQFHVKKPNSVNFSPYFDPNDPLIVKKFEFFVLKKMQTNPKILFNDPKFASNTSFFFGFSGLEIINQEKPYFLFVAIYSRLTIFLYWTDLTISANSSLNHHFICAEVYENHLRETAHNAWKASKYGVISGPYFPSLGLNGEKYKVRNISPYSIRMRENTHQK